MYQKRWILNCIITCMFYCSTPALAWLKLGNAEIKDILSGASQHIQSGLITVNRLPDNLYHLDIDDAVVLDKIESLDVHLSLQAPSIHVGKYTSGHQRLILLSSGTIDFDDTIHCQQLLVQANHLEFTSKTRILANVIAVQGLEKIHCAGGSQFVTYQNHSMETQFLQDNSHTLALGQGTYKGASLHFGARYQLYTYQPEIKASHTLNLYQGAQIHAGPCARLMADKKLLLQGNITQSDSLKSFKETVHTLPYTHDIGGYQVRSQKNKTRGLFLYSHRFVDATPALSIHTYEPIHVRAPKVNYRAKHPAKIVQGAAFTLTANDILFDTSIQNTTQTLFEPLWTVLRLQPSKADISGHIDSAAIKILNEKCVLKADSQLKSDDIKFYARFFTQAANSRVISKQDLSILNASIAIIKGQLKAHKVSIESDEDTLILGQVSSNRLHAKAKNFLLHHATHLDVERSILLTVEELVYLRGLITGCQRCIDVHSGKNIRVEDLTVSGQSALSLAAKNSVSIEDKNKINAYVLVAESDKVNINSQTDIDTKHTEITAKELLYKGRSFQNVARYDVHTFKVGASASLYHKDKAEIRAHNTLIEGFFAAKKLQGQGKNLQTSARSLLHVSHGQLDYQNTWVDGRIKSDATLDVSGHFAQINNDLNVKRRLNFNLDILHLGSDAQLNSEDLIQIQTQLKTDIQGLITANTVIVKSGGALALHSQRDAVNAGEIAVSGAIKAQLLTLMSDNVHVLSSGRIDTKQQAFLAGKLKTCIDGLITGNGTVVVHGENVFVSQFGAIHVGGELDVKAAHGTFDGQVSAQNIQGQFSELVKVGHTAHITGEDTVRLIGQLKADIYGYIAAKEAEVKTNGTLTQGGAITAQTIKLVGEQFEQLESGTLTGKKRIQVISDLEAIFRGITESQGDFGVKAKDAHFARGSTQQVDGMAVISAMNAAMDSTFEAAKLISQTQTHTFGKGAKVRIAQGSVFDGEVRVFEGSKVDLKDTWVKGKALVLEDNTQATFGHLHVPDADHVRLGGDIILDSMSLKARLLEHRAHLEAEQGVSFEADTLDVAAQAVTDADIVQMVAHKKFSHQGDTTGRKNVFVKTTDGVVPLGTFHSDGWISLDSAFTEAQVLDLLANPKSHLDGGIYVVADVDVTLDRDIQNSKGLGGHFRSLTGEDKAMRAGDLGMDFKTDKDIALTNVLGQSQGNIRLESHGDASFEGKWSDAASSEAAQWQATQLVSKKGMVDIKAGRDIHTRAVQFSGEQGVHLDAGRSIQDKAATRSYSWTSSYRYGWFGCMKCTKHHTETQTQASQWYSNAGHVKTNALDDCLFEGTKQTAGKGVYNLNQGDGHMEYLSVKGLSSTHESNKFLGAFETSSWSRSDNVVREAATLMGQEKVHVQTKGKVTGHGIVILSPDVLIRAKRLSLSGVEQQHKSHEESFGFYLTGAARNLKNLAQGAQMFAQDPSVKNAVHNPAVNAAGFGGAGRALKGASVLTDVENNNALDKLAAGYEVYAGAKRVADMVQNIRKNGANAVGQALQVTDAAGDFAPAVGFGISYHKDEQEWTTHAPAQIQANHVVLDIDEDIELIDGVNIDAETGVINARELLVKGAQNRSKHHHEGWHMEFTREAEGVVDVEAGYETRNQHGTTGQQSVLNFTGHLETNIGSATLDNATLRAKSLGGQLHNLTIISRTDSHQGTHENGMIGGKIVDGAFIPNRVGYGEGADNGEHVNAAAVLDIEEGIDGAALGLKKVHLQGGLVKVGDHATLDLTQTEVIGEGIDEHDDSHHNGFNVCVGDKDVDISVQHQSENSRSTFRAGLCGGTIKTGKVKGLVAQFNQGDAVNQREHQSYKKRDFGVTASVSKEDLRKCFTPKQGKPATPAQGQAPTQASGEDSSAGDVGSDADPEPEPDAKLKSGKDKRKTSRLVLEPIAEEPVSAPEASPKAEPIADAKSEPKSEPKPESNPTPDKPAPAEEGLADAADIHTPVQNAEGESLPSAVDRKSMQAQLDDFAKAWLQQTGCSLSDFEAAFKAVQKDTESDLTATQKLRKVYDNLTDAQGGYVPKLGQGENLLRDENLLKASKWLLDKLPFEHNCFTEETLVLTESGFKPIAWVEIGEKVLSRATPEDKPRWQPVRKVFQNHVDNLVELRIQSQMTTIRTTTNHPFAVAREHRSHSQNAAGDTNADDDPDPESALESDVERDVALGFDWVAAGDLSVGDVLLDAQNQQTIVEAITHYEGAYTTYNLHVADTESYFVAAGAMPRDRSQEVDALWVHNCTPEEALEKGKKFSNLFGTSHRLQDLHDVVTGYKEGQPLSDFDRASIVMTYIISRGAKAAKVQKNLDHVEQLRQSQAALDALQNDDPDALTDMLVEQAGRKAAGLGQDAAAKVFGAKGKGRKGKGSKDTSSASDVGQKGTSNDRRDLSPSKARTPNDNKMVRACHKNQAPKGITRIDKGEIFYDKKTGKDIATELSHVHFKNGAALYYDGTWKHGHTILTNEQKKWLKKYGWTLPKD